MASYLSPAQMLGLLTLWATLAILASQVSPTGLFNVLIFCTLPLWLSSVQLFFVGTYLPHRGQNGLHAKPAPESLDLPAPLSLLACFHFGYHREHHDNPGLSWFQLPSVRQALSRSPRSPGSVQPTPSFHA